jgi:erythronate-4-phosphate dehydrogenase
MRILADSNISMVAEAFSGLGTVTTLPSHEITRDALTGVDVLLSRSTIKVDSALLEGTSLRFYATATSGTDHVDVDALRSRGVGFASAHGSNAPAVAQWFAAALDRAGFGFDWSGLTIGVVGVGAVGARVVAMATAMGARTLCCDPPRARRGDTCPGTGAWLDLDDVLPASNVVTFHVPWTTAGADATAGFVGGERLSALPTGAVFVNASRGAIVETGALLSSGRRMLLDVFAGEPDFATALVDAAELATPHVAGHSIEGKLDGTKMIADAAFQHFEGRAAPWSPQPPVPTSTLVSSPSQAVQSRCLLETSDRALRAMCTLPNGERGRAFRAYRRGFVHRHEFYAGAVVHADPEGILARLGFNVLAPPDAG